MLNSEPVTVYHFRTFTRGVEFERIADFKATREAIERRYQGEIMEGTGEVVDARELDAHGHYRRIATGWGSL